MGEEEGDGVFGGRGGVGEVDLRAPELVPQGEGCGG